jgi:hypothetical protein
MGKNEGILHPKSMELRNVEIRLVEFYTFHADSVENTGKLVCQRSRFPSPIVDTKHLQH